MKFGGTLMYFLDEVHVIELSAERVNITPTLCVSFTLAV